MPRKKPKIICAAIGKAAADNRETVRNALFDRLLLLARKPKTAADRVYDLIEDACYLWFEDENGRPWIAREDVEDKGGGIYIVRFRCPIAALYTNVSLNRVVDKVCETLKSDKRYFCKECEVVYFGSIRQRYYECVWVICEGELATDEAEPEKEVFNAEEELENFV